MVAAITFQNVSRSFGTVRAVDGASFEIAPGEFFAMLGPSGSGKTTCLRLIAGFDQPTSGHIELFGETAEGVPPYRRHVNTVFQDYALFPHMNVLENVAYGLKVKGVARPEQETRAREALSLVKLVGMEQRRPAQLSGGQRQRVALARALVNRPKALLLDEPLGALDLKLREQMQVELKALQQKLGITFVFVTHDQGEALSMADRVAIFNEGRLVQLGTPREVYDEPATTFVASFMGNPPMNLAEAGRAGDRTLAWGAVTIAVNDLPAGERFVLGVRPEHVHIEGSRWSGTTRAEGTFDALVDVVESIGDQILLELDAGGRRLIARVEPSFPAMRGDRVRAWLNPDRLHLFDPETGAAIRHGSSG
ncbi:MAG: ABC transporter ATP-binding protein [Propylenella sp.]